MLALRALDALGLERLERLDQHRLLEWLEQYRQFWELRLDALEAYVAVKAKERGQAHGKFR